MKVSILSVLMTMLISAATAEPLTIIGFDTGSGMTFQGATVSNYYTLEFAPTASGPWTNWGSVCGQAITGTVMALPSPFFYRIRQTDGTAFPPYAPATNIPGSMLADGAVSGAKLAPNSVDLSGPAVTGTIPGNRMPGNVALLDAAQTFTGPSNRFTGSTHFVGQNGMVLGTGVYVCGTDKNNQPQRLIGLDTEAPNGSNPPATVICADSGGSIAFTDYSNNTRAWLDPNGGENSNVLFYQGGYSNTCESMHHMRGVAPRTTYEGTEAHAAKWAVGEVVSGSNSYYQIYNVTAGNIGFKIHESCLRYQFHANGYVIQWGYGNPNEHVTAPMGSLYMNYGGGASNTLWVKESGDGDTGWVAK